MLTTCKTNNNMKTFGTSSEIVAKVKYWATTPTNQTLTRTASAIVRASWLYGTTVLSTRCLFVK